MVSLGVDAEQEETLRSLRNALAVMRGVKYLETISTEVNSTIEQDAGNRIDYLNKLFARAHGELFKDWTLQAFGESRPGQISESSKRAAMRDAISSILCDSEAGLFDKNGHVVSRDGDLPDILAKFYSEVKRIAPFEYGTQITLDFFMVSLSKLPAFQEVYDARIDFRRLSADQKQVLNKSTDSAEIAKAFEQALYGKAPLLDNSRDEFKLWNNSSTKIKGVPFLSHKNEVGEQFLVTIDGGLVPIEEVRSELENWIDSSRQIADFPPIDRDRIVGYLPGGEESPRLDSYEIDGILVENGDAPLFCLGVNILTGLYGSRHNEIEDLVKRFGDEPELGIKPDIFTLANNPELKQRLLRYAENAGHSQDLTRSIEIAYERLSKITVLMDYILDNEIFKGVTSVDNPGLVDCAGGAGAGKSTIKDIAKQLFGKNFAIGSLDDNRNFSMLHKVLLRAGHHGDDYRFSEPFANALRTWSARRAMKDKCNFLWDGTAIPFEGKNLEIVKGFKAAGFNTNLVMADIPLNMAIQRVEARAVKENRALPWAVVVGKHVKAAMAFMGAVASNAVDKASLFAKERDFGDHYLVSETFTIKSDEVEAFQVAQREGRLQDEFSRLIYSREDSILKLDAAASGTNVHAKIGKMPNFNEKNIAYLTSPASDGYTLLAIYDVKRFVELVEKGLKNPHASTLVGLEQLPSAVPFVTALAR